MDIDKHDYLGKFQPIEIKTVRGETGEEFVVDTIDKTFLSKIIIRPDFPEEDTAELVELSLHIGQLAAHAEKFAFYCDKNLEKFKAITRRVAKEENPKLTVQGLEDFVIDTDEYSRLTTRKMDAEETAYRMKQLNHTVSRVKLEMLKTRGFNKL